MGDGCSDPLVKCCLPVVPSAVPVPPLQGTHARGEVLWAVSRRDCPPDGVTAVLLANWGLSSPGPSTGFTSCHSAARPRVFCPLFTASSVCIGAGECISILFHCFCFFCSASLSLPTCSHCPHRHLHTPAHASSCKLAQNLCTDKPVPFTSTKCFSSGKSSTRRGWLT